MRGRSRNPKRLTGNDQGGFHEEIRSRPRRHAARPVDLDHRRRARRRGARGARGRAAGQMTWAVHISLAPTWFDPAETSGIITPYMLLYALHDALVKPM